MSHGCTRNKRAGTQGGVSGVGKPLEKGNRFVDEWGFVVKRGVKW